MTVTYLPPFVLLKRRPLRALNELVETDHPVVVLVDLLDHMFPHPVHLLVPFHLVILGCVWIIQLIKL